MIVPRRFWGTIHYHEDLCRVSGPLQGADDGRAGSELGVSDSARVWQDVTDVVYARKVHDQALEAQAETCVRAAAIAPKVKIVPILPQVHAQLTHAPLEHVETLLSLGTPYNLPDAGHQAVCCGHGPAVVVRAHVEGLDVGGVVTHKGGSLEVLLGKEALVTLCSDGAPEVPSAIPLD